MESIISASSPMSLNVTREIGYVFLSLIILALLYRAYVYLGDIQTCACAPTQYVGNLKNIEFIYIVVGLVGVLLNVLYLTFHLKFDNLFNKSTMKTVLSGYGVGMFAVYVYYIYNLVLFNNAIQPNCGCTDAWQNVVMNTHALYLSLPIIMFVLGYLFDFKMNSNILVLFIVIVALIYLFENYSMRRSPMEAFTSLLGPANNSMFEPKLYFDRGLFDKNPSCGCGKLDLDTVDFSPRNGQPTQVYRQQRPDEYPASRQGVIQTPLSTHERLIKEYR